MMNSFVHLSSADGKSMFSLITPLTISTGIPSFIYYNPHVVAVLFFYPAAVQVQLDMVTNESYFLNEPEPEITVLPQDLMSYSWQIACGMVRSNSSDVFTLKQKCTLHSLQTTYHLVFQEFLSGYKIVHRDLAARNILICGGTRTLKIADFGLSRDIYEENCYTNKTNVVMPIKWLAVECLLQDVYTTKSDVYVSRKETLP